MRRGPAHSPNGNFINVAIYVFAFFHFPNMSCRIEAMVLNTPPAMIFS